MPLTMPVINLQNSYIFFLHNKFSHLFLTQYPRPDKIGFFQNILLLDSAFLILEDIQERLIGLAMTQFS